MSERVCEGCSHWYRVPATAETLGQPPQGECRCQPPQVTLMPARDQVGNTVLTPVTLYPRTLAVWPACGQYREDNPCESCAARIIEG